MAGQRDGRATAAGGIQQRRRGHGSSSVDELRPAKSTVPGAQPAVSRARRLGDTGRPPLLLHKGRSGLPGTPQLRRGWGRVVRPRTVRVRSVDRGGGDWLDAGSFSGETRGLATAPVAQKRRGLKDE